MLPALWGGWAGAARSHKLQWRALLLAALQMALPQVTSFQKKGFAAKNNFKTTEWDDLSSAPSSPEASDF